MAVKTVKVGPGILTFGSEDDLIQCSSQVTSCAIEPDTDTDDPIMVLSGESVAGKYTESYKLTGTFLQDFASEKGVTEYTWDNGGKTVPFSFTPATAGGRSVTGRVQIVPTKIGGDVGENADADFEFGCIGKPSLGPVTVPNDA